MCSPRFFRDFAVITDDIRVSRCQSSAAFPTARSIQRKVGEGENIEVGAGCVNQRRGSGSPRTARNFLSTKDTKSTKLAVGNASPQFSPLSVLSALSGQSGFGELCGCYAA